MQCCISPERDDCCLLPGYICRFYYNRPIFRQTHVLSISAKTHSSLAKNMVTFSKQFYIFANCFNFPGQFIPEYSCFFWSCEAVEKSYSKWISLSHATVSRCYRCRIYFYENLIVFGSGFCNLPELQDLRWSIC